LLERFVERSRELTGARYGAMSVLGNEGRISEFITSGISAQERALLGDPPTGHGLLGVIIREGRALRLEDLTRHPQSVGFPEHHPEMHSLLGVPVISRGRTIGNLYLTEKEDAPSFTEADEEMVRTFAAYAAVAVETSRLLEELRLLAVLRERERIGMDLHDGIIQSIYAVGLGLEAASEDVEADPASVKRAIDTAITQLDATIRDVRNYIFELRPEKLTFDLSDSIAALVQEFKENSRINVETRIAPALPPVPESQRSAVYHITREALVNVRKHAGASTVRLALHAEPAGLHLSIEDDGAGFDPALVGDGHHGVRNMTARAEAAGGRLSVRSEAGRGSRIDVEIPIGTSEGVMP
jgi:signal transduction histidine kinase